MQEYQEPTPEDLSQMVYGNGGDEAKTTQRAIVEEQLHQTFLSTVKSAADKIASIVLDQMPGASPRLQFEAAKYVLEFEFNPRDNAAKADDPLANMMKSMTVAEKTIARDDIDGDGFS